MQDAELSIPNENELRVTECWGVFSKDSVSMELNGLHEWSSFPVLDSQPVYSISFSWISALYESNLFSYFAEQLTQILKGDTLPEGESLPAESASDWHIFTGTTSLAHLHWHIFTGSFPKFSKLKDPSSASPTFHTFLPFHPEMIRLLGGNSSFSVNRDALQRTLGRASKAL